MIPKQVVFKSRTSGSFVFWDKVSFFFGIYNLFRFCIVVVVNEGLQSATVYVAPIRPSVNSYFDIDTKSWGPTKNNHLVLSYPFVWISLRQPDAVSFNLPGLYNLIDVTVCRQPLLVSVSDKPQEAQESVRLRTHSVVYGPNREQSFIFEDWSRVRDVYTGALPSVSTQSAEFQKRKYGLGSLPSLEELVILERDAEGYSRPVIVQKKDLPHMGNICPIRVFELNDSTSLFFDPSVIDIWRYCTPGIVKGLGIFLEEIVPTLVPFLLEHKKQDYFADFEMQRRLTNGVLSLLYRLLCTIGILKRAEVDYLFHRLPQIGLEPKRVVAPTPEVDLGRAIEAVEKSLLNFLPNLLYVELGSCGMRNLTVSKNIPRTAKMMAKTICEQVWHDWNQYPLEAPSRCYYL